MKDQLIARSLDQAPEDPAYLSLLLLTRKR